MHSLKCIDAEPGMLGPENRTWDPGTLRHPDLGL